MSDEDRDRLIRRMAAHQLRMGEAIAHLVDALHPSSAKDEVLLRIGEQNHFLARAIEETE